MTAKTSPPARKRAASQRRYKPGEQDRKLVETLAGYGVPPEEICRLVVNPASGKALTPRALLRHFGEEIAGGLAAANAKVAESLYRLAVGQAKVVVDGEVLQEEREPKVTAAIFWAKTRMGWKEISAQDAAAQRNGNGRGGGPIVAEAKVTVYIPENGREQAQTAEPETGGHEAEGGGCEAVGNEADGREAGGNEVGGGSPPASPADSSPEGPAGELPRDVG